MKTAEPLAALMSSADSPLHRDHPLQLGPGEHLYVRDANGDVWGLCTGPDGNLEVWLPSGGTVLARSTAGNVMQVYSWPTFQPLRPPSPEQPAQVSRDFVHRLLPNGDGLPSEYVELVQEAVDRDPAVRSVLESAVHRTLEVVESPMYGTKVEPRDKSKIRKR